MPTDHPDADHDTDLDLEIRRAIPGDYEAVVDLTADVWADRGGDYLPEVYHDWLEDAGEDRKKTFVAETDGELAGLVQAVMLSPDEAWFQTMRVDSAYRRRGVSRRLNEATFSWARERGATVGRVLIFSWNGSSMAAARTAGFQPVTEFRFAHPEPDATAPLPDGFAVSSDPAAAWRYWEGCDARAHLRGLALAPEETWALRAVAHQDLASLPVHSVRRDEGVGGTTWFVREFERSTDDGESRTIAEYGVAVWDDLESARALVGAIARDAADRGADEVRVPVPETARAVTDAAAAGARIADEPEFVLAVDLS